MWFLVVVLKCVIFLSVALSLLLHLTAVQSLEHPKAAAVVVVKKADPAKVAERNPEMAQVINSPFLVTE